MDFEGTSMPPPEAIAGTFRAPGGDLIKVPPLSDEDKLTLVRWIDLGCPINLDESDRGWLLDEGRPTLTLTEPQPGLHSEPLTRILLGMHDHYTGLDLDGFLVTADFEIDGVPVGENLATHFRSLPDHRWEWKLATPITTLERGTLTVSIRDRRGNLTRIERTFGIRIQVR